MVQAAESRQGLNLAFSPRADCCRPTCWEVWGWMRDWLKAGAEIPDDPELAVDLTAPGYDTARGKRFHGSIQLEQYAVLRCFSVSARWI